MSDSDLEATLEKELVRARLEVELFQKQRPVRLGRFEVVRCIGRGSLGVVYEARDTDHGGRVALKLLRRVDARTIAQFKHEFRVLSGIIDPNLVALHELISERERWFVSMELIEGMPFDHWLRAEAGAAVDEARLRDALAQLVHAVSVIHRAGKLHRDLKPSNVLVTSEGRVVVLDYGLVSAAYAPKEGGPLVAPAELGSPRGAALSDSSQWRQGALRASPPVLIGTPGYMAPEQAGREPAQEASDWYAVGVMLFEVLAQRLPFDGTTRDVLRDKQLRAAPRLRDLNPRVTHALDGLCRRLLEREPSRRGGPTELEAWLGRRSSPPMRALARARVSAPLPLAGRAAELQLLASALESARSGGARVWVSGVPGIGKTALLDGFAASAPPGTLVLRGRCHEEESIPLKLFDAIADALRAAFIDSDAQFDALTAHERAALLATFPVLGDIPGLAPAESELATVRSGSSQPSDAERETVPMPDAEVVREANAVAAKTEPLREAPAAEVQTELEALRELAATAEANPTAEAAEVVLPAAPSYASACAALSTLLASLALRRPVAILLDDLQWADDESAKQFERVFGPPAAPPLLFVGAFRREREDATGATHGWRGALDSPPLAADSRTQHIELGPLLDAASSALAESLLRAHGLPATPELCRKLARDTRGIPFLMTELVSQLKRPRRSSAFARSSTGAIALSSAIQTRIEALPSGARRLLAVLCVAPAPLALRSALYAANLPIDEHAALTLLRSARLARSRGGRPIETLEPYHERVRESVLQVLSAEERSEIAREIEAAQGRGQGVSGPE